MSLIWPNGSTTIPRVKSEWGMRLHPIQKVMKLHRGIDLAKGWKRVVSPIAGRVEKVAFEAGGAGNYVNVRGDDGVLMKFFHLSSTAVTQGQRVAVGTHLGQMGATGGVTGEHLHFEVWVGGSSVDPRKFYAERSGSVSASPKGILMALTDEEQTELLTRVRNLDGWVSSGGKGVDGQQAKSGTIAQAVLEIRDAIGARNAIGMDPKGSLLGLARDMHRHLGSANATTLKPGVTLLTQLVERVRAGK